MSRYIDVSDLNIPSDENDYDELVAFADKVAEMITDAPSIDIVRCKECKHASDNKVYGCMCNHFNDNDWDYHRMYADDFCSRGEREGE